jgi:Fe-S cluster biogenesis protein NfuA
MYAVLRQYAIDSSHVEEAVRRAREGFIPLIRSIPGFVAYGMADAGAAGLMTISIFKDQAGAEESVRKAASYVKDNLAAFLPTPPRVTRGPVLFHQAKPDGQFGYGVMRRYRCDPSNLEEVARRVGEGLVPLITSVPGFAAYFAMDPEDGTVVSMGAFADRASAEASTATAREWVGKNLADLIPDPPEVTPVTIKFRVAAPSAARA